jgi:two-component system OmpR family sensor kinase
LKTLRGRLVAATLSALALTLILTIAIGAVLTRQQVDQAQVSALARQADGIAIARRESVSYVNGTQLLAGGELAIVNPRPFFARLVPEVNRSSNGTTSYQGKRYIFSYRTIPARGLLLLRSASVNSAAWHPFLGDLLLAGLAGAALAAALSFLVARSIVRPVRRVAEASHALAVGETPTRLPEEGARELVSLAQAFNEMAEQLAVSRESERNFLLSVSHELKTPLTAIRGYAEGLSEGAFGAEDASRTILVEARRLERLVRDLLDLARMNRREFSVRREAVDLGEVAREAAARHEAAAREFDVSLAAEGGESWVEADHDRLIQVASNLVENALRETPQGGTVTVRAEPRRLVVSDTGPGLELDDLPHVFDRFFLYDKYGRERPVGSGLGLAIVRQLTEAMGGTIAVESEPGSGATFVVTLLPALAPRLPAAVPTA